MIPQLEANRDRRISPYFPLLFPFGIAGFLLAMAFSTPAHAQVVISQVLYDPVKTEAGGEFVLLENKGIKPVPVGAWTLETSASVKDVTLPKDAVIDSGKTFLIADKGWNTSRDNLSWPLADLEETMTLGNQDSGVALSNNGTIMDAVGWGNVSNPRLFQGTPARPAKKGNSLQRVSLTGSNAVDFRQAIASFSPGEEGTAPGTAPRTDIAKSIDLDLTVVDLLAEPPKTVNISFSIEDDDPAQGFQLVPFPGALRLVRINVSWPGSPPEEVRISAWGNNMSFVLPAVNSSEKQGLKPNEPMFNSSIELLLNLSYAQPPGIYPLDAAALSKGVVFGFVSNTITILPVLSISIDSRGLNLGNVSHGTTIIIRGDEDPLTPDKPTVWNSGNIAAGLSITKSDIEDITSGREKIHASFVDVALRRYKKTSSFIVNGAQAVAESQDGLPQLHVGEAAGLDVSIEIPGVSSGNYRGRLWIVAQSPQR